MAAAASKKGNVRWQAFWGGSEMSPQPPSRQAGGQDGQGRALHQDTWNITSAARCLSRWHGRHEEQRSGVQKAMPGLDSKPLLARRAAGSNLNSRSGREPSLACP